MDYQRWYKNMRKEDMEIEDMAKLLNQKFNEAENKTHEEISKKE